MQDPFGWSGAVIGERLAVEGPVGEGAYGVVYRGYHRGLQKPVAIKCLKIPEILQQSDREELVRGFKAEAGHLFELSRVTTGVIQVYDFDSALSPRGILTPYIVMEWLQGRSLHQLLDARRADGHPPFSLTEAWTLLAPAVAALALAHERGIAHRDVKPANLFLAEIQGRETMKVVDFGIAKVLATHLSYTQALFETEGRRSPCSPRYAAPEQFSPDLGATGPWTDVFALALVYLELVSGRHGLAGENVVDLALAAVDDQRRPTFALRGVHASAAQEAALAGALAVHPRNRYASMDQLQRAFDDSFLMKQGGQVAEPRSQGAAPSGKRRTTPKGGENRLCTALFVEVTGLDVLRASLPADDMRAIAEPCFNAISSAVEALDGHLVTFSAVGAYCVFGFPSALDNDAERAVLVAARLQKAVQAALGERAFRRLRLSVRVGIQTGTVFTGDLEGADRREAAPLGQTFREAHRIAACAPPGSVVLSHVVRRHVEGLFNLHALGSADDQAPLFRLGETPTPSFVLARTDFYGAATSTFGRAPDLGKIVEAIETVVLERRPLVVTVLGDAGLGRTRLLADTMNELVRRQESFLILVARASQLARNTPYSFVAALLRTRFALTPLDNAETILRKLRAGARLYAKRASKARAPTALSAPTLAELEPIVALLASGWTLAPSPLPVDREDTGVAGGSRIAPSVARLLDFAGGLSPVVVLCDDVHFADEASLTLLRDLPAHAPNAPVLVIMTARSDFDDLRLPRGLDQSTHVRIELGPLAQRHMDSIARDCLRVGAEANEPWLAPIVTRAGRNPRVLRELLHLLVDTGALSQAGERGWAPTPGRTMDVTVPSTVRGIAQARLDRLDAVEREVVAQAAIFGQSFAASAVASLRDVGKTPSAVDTQRPTALVLGRLRERQIFRLREKAAPEGDQEYTFADPILREVAYDTLNSQIRRQYHGVAGIWLAERGADAELLARHALAAGRFADAVERLQNAATHATQLGRSVEALRYYDQLSTLLDRASEGGDLVEHPLPLSDLRICPWDTRVRIHVSRADILRRMGRHTEAKDAYEAARRCVLRTERRSGDTLAKDQMPPGANGAAVGQSLPVEGELWEARIDARLGLAHKVRGELDEALALVQRAISRATRAGVLSEVPSMHVVLAGIHWHRGDRDSCKTVVREGLRLARKLPKGTASVVTVSMLLDKLGACFYASRQWTRAERCHLQAFRALDPTVDPGPAAAALNNVAVVRLAAGQTERASQAFAQALPLKEREGDLHHLAIGYGNLAEVELMLGKNREALEHARTSVRYGEQAQATSDLPDFRCNQALAALAMSLPAEALEAARRAFDETLARGSWNYLRRSVETLGCVITDVLQRGGDSETRSVAIDTYGEVSETVRGLERLDGRERERLLQLLSGAQDGGTVPPGAPR